LTVVLALAVAAAGLAAQSLTIYTEDSPPYNFTIASLDDAKEVAKVGVYQNDVGDQILTAKGLKNLDRSNDVITPIKKLMVARISLVASTPDEIGPLVEKAGYQLADVKMLYVFQRIQVFIAASKATPPELVAKWQDALDAMKKDGSFEKIFHKYLPLSPLPGPAITAF
jgi:polar amino acid transport system substrate-binding protein